MYNIVSICWSSDRVTYKNTCYTAFSFTHPFHNFKLLSWEGVVNKVKGEGGQDRSSRPECFYIKGVVGNFTKFTGKQLYQSILFKKTFSYRTPPVAASDKIGFYEKFLVQEGDVKFRKFCNCWPPYS